MGGRSWGGAGLWAHLSCCSAGSWGPRRSGRGSRFHHRTPTGGSSDSARWRSGTRWGHRSGTLGAEGRGEGVRLEAPAGPRCREGRARPCCHRHSGPPPPTGRPTRRRPSTLTTLGGLVGAVRAVPVVVAHEVLGDALAILAHELAVVAGAVVHCGWRRADVAPQPPPDQPLPVPGTFVGSECTDSHLGCRQGSATNHLSDPG